MNELRYTLVSDGSSDRVLLPILNWLLVTNGVACAIQSEWADLRRVSRVRRATLSEKIRLALDLYPCDLLFVHRDAEGASWRSREKEIRRAIEQVEFCDLPYVCVVPVRMQEAWLLFDEGAIRYAAGNQNGRMCLGLPLLRDVEDLPNPKARLHECLRVASGLRERRLRQFRPHANVWRIADYIADYSPLRGVPAFDRLESEIEAFASSRNWNTN